MNNLEDKDPVKSFCKICRNKVNKCKCPKAGGGGGAGPSGSDDTQTKTSTNTLNLTNSITFSKITDLLSLQNTPVLSRESIDYTRFASLYSLDLSKPLTLTFRGNARLSLKEQDELQEFFDAVLLKFKEFKNELLKKGISVENFSAVKTDNELTIHIPLKELFEKFMQFLLEHKVLSPEQLKPQHSQAAVSNATAAPSATKAPLTTTVPLATEAPLVTETASVSKSWPPVPRPYKTHEETNG